MAEDHVKQERWVLIAYVLMLLTLVLGLTWIIALWVNQSMLNQPHEVWIRSHQLWIIRSCVVFSVLLVLVGLLSLPLIWLPLSHGIGLVFSCAAAVMVLVSISWLLYRSFRGLRRFMQGKAVY